LTNSCCCGIANAEVILQGRRRRVIRQLDTGAIKLGRAARNLSGNGAQYIRKHLRRSRNILNKTILFYESSRKRARSWPSNSRRCKKPDPLGCFYSVLSNFTIYIEILSKIPETNWQAAPAAIMNTMNELNLKREL
jgi:hypothetical protein